MTTVQSIILLVTIIKNLDIYAICLSTHVQVVLLVVVSFVYNIRYVFQDMRRLIPFIYFSVRTLGLLMVFLGWLHTCVIFYNMCGSNAYV